jgi:hypothetical protein
MNLGRAQALALRENFLDTLGAAPVTGALPVIEEILGMAAKEFIDAAVVNLYNSSSVSTGELAASLTFAVNTQGAGTYILSVGYPKGSNAARYWDFNNQGVQGVNKPGKAPHSPYKFRYLGVSPRHALALLKWYRHNGRSATNIHKDHPVSGLERKRVNLRGSIKESNNLSGLAYATAMKMKIEGLEPSQYFDKATQSTFGPDLMEALAVALGGDVILNIRKYRDDIL